MLFSDAVTLKPRGMLSFIGNNQAMEKKQASCCCTADVCLHQCVNQLYNNQKMAKLVLFPLIGKKHQSKSNLPVVVWAGVEEVTFMISQ